MSATEAAGPAHRGAIAAGEHLLTIEDRRGAEELRHRLPHRRLTHVALPVRGRREGLPDAVIGHGRHEGIDITAIQRGIQPFNGLDRCAGCLVVHAIPRRCSAASMPLNNAINRGRLS
jgi:hypothetical protein